MSKNLINFITDGNEHVLEEIDMKILKAQKSPRCKQRKCAKNTKIDVTKFLGAGKLASTAVENQLELRIKEKKKEKKLKQRSK